MANQQVTTLLKQQVETRSQGLGQNVRITAKTLHTVAGELRQDAETHGAADMADRGADFIERIGIYLEQSDFDALISDAEEFSRKRPWAVATIGAAAGLVASRLLKSTATRRQSRDNSVRINGT